MEIRDLIGVFAILNPIGAIPLFLSLTGSRSHAEMRRIAAKTALAVVTILLIATWLGQRLLQLFGIGVPAFRFAGGLLVLRSR